MTCSKMLTKVLFYGLSLYVAVSLLLSVSIADDHVITTCPCDDFVIFAEEYEENAPWSFQNDAPDIEYDVINGVTYLKYTLDLPVVFDSFVTYICLHLI